MKPIRVQATRFGGAYFDLVHVNSANLEQTIKDCYLNQGFTFTVEKACCLVTDAQVAKVKELLGLKK